MIPLAHRSTVGLDAHTISLAGELDLGTGAEATALLCDDHVMPIVVDMTDLEFIDCAGHRAIVVARRVAEERGTTLTVVHARGQPARFLGLLAGSGPA